MEKSVYVIKPEAVSAREEIRAVIQDAGLYIVAIKLASLSREAIEGLYPSVTGGLRAATLHYMSLRPCEIGVVGGDNAVSRLCMLAGGSVNPGECEPWTIRARFGSPIPVRLLGTVYYLNGFHRSRNASEVAHDLALFDTLPN